MVGFIKYICIVALIVSVALADKQQQNFRDLSLLCIEHGCKQLTDKQQNLRDLLDEVDVYAPKYNLPASNLGSIVPLDLPKNNIPDDLLFINNQPVLDPSYIDPTFEPNSINKPKTNIQLEMEKIEREKEKNNYNYDTYSYDNQFEINTIKQEDEKNLLIEDTVEQEEAKHNYDDQPESIFNKNNNQAISESNATKFTEKLRRSMWGTYAKNYKINEKSKSKIWITYAKGGSINEDSFSIGGRFDSSWGVDLYKSFALEFDQGDNFYDFSIPHNNYMVIDDSAIKNSFGMDLIYFIDFKEKQSMYIKGGFYNETTCKLVRSRDTGWSYCNEKDSTYLPSAGIGYMYDYKNIVFSIGYHIRRGIEVSIGF